MNRLPNLPRTPDGSYAREFKGKTKKWYIRTAADGIGIYRYSELQKMQSVLGFSATFKEQVTRWNEMENILLSDYSTIEMRKRGLTHINAAKDGILDISKRRYSMAIYVCSLFIVSEDEDLTVWNKDLAEAKAVDWEGYHENDFLTLALITIEGYKSVYEKENQRMKAAVDTLQSVTED